MTVQLRRGGVYLDRDGRAWRVIQMGSATWLHTAGVDPVPYLSVCEDMPVDRPERVQWRAADGGLYPQLPDDALRRGAVRASSELDLVATWP